jgi:hypothetical protein
MLPELARERTNKDDVGLHNQQCDPCSQLSQTPVCLGNARLIIVVSDETSASGCSILARQSSQEPGAAATIGKVVMYTRQEA